MPENIPGYYQAPLEVNSYVNPTIAPVPQRPTGLYGMFNITPKKAVDKTSNPYQKLMSGEDLFRGGIPDVAPLQTNLATLAPLDDAAGLFHSQDGFGKYGYSSILNNGDNEDRYSSNFRRDNPNKFYTGYNPLKWLYKGGYWGGGFLEKTLEGAVVKTGQGFASLYGLTLGNIIGAAQGNTGFSNWITNSADNVFSNFFNDWDGMLKERYHYFQEKSDRDKKGFVASLSDGDFWMNDISDGLSFLTSAMFEAGLIGKLGTAVKGATRISPLAEGVSTEALVTGAAKAPNLLTRGLNALGVEGSGPAMFVKATDMATQTLATTVIESATEAQQTKDDVYNSFQGKINPETGMVYSDDEKKRLAAQAAAEVFKQNMTILVGPKFLEVAVFHNIGRALKGAFGKTAEAAEDAGKASGRVKVGSRLGAVDKDGKGINTSYSRLSALRKARKYGTLAGVGFLSEGLFEENIQQAIQTTAADNFGAGEFYRPGTDEETIDKLGKEDQLFGDVGKLYGKQTKQFFKGIFDDRYIDDQLSKSIGIGGLFGVGGGLIHGNLNMRQQAKIDRYWTNQLNAVNTNLFQPGKLYKTDEKGVVFTDENGLPVIDDQKVRGVLNEANNIKGVMDIIKATEDPSDQNNQDEQNKFLNKLAKNVLFSKLAMSYIRAGKKEDLLRNLMSASNFSDQDIQALGYDPAYMTPEDKAKILKEATLMVERLDKSHEWIENNVIDNGFEKGDKFFGLKDSATQKIRRRETLEKKKAYLQGLAMQNAILDSYLDSVNEADSKLNREGDLIVERTPLNEFTQKVNAKLPAINNQLEILRQELAYHFEKLRTTETTSPKGKAGTFNPFNKDPKNKTIATEVHFHQAKFEDTLQKIDALENESDQIKSENKKFLEENEDYTTVTDSGNIYVVQKNQSDEAQELAAINNEKLRRINDIKREEIKIQKGWIAEEWKNTAALKEEKTRQGRKDTPFSRRMTGSRNAYNKFFEREVAPRDDSEGKPKIKLYHDEEDKRIDSKKYVNNENKLLKYQRIRGKIAEILASVNGKSLVAQIEALLSEDLSGQEFNSELKSIINQFNGKPITIDPASKDMLNERLQDTEDELNFASNLLEFQPDDERFNDKYYDIDNSGNMVVKPEYDDMFEMGRVLGELEQQIDDINKIKAYLDKIESEKKGDWSNLDFVKKDIASGYFETADNYISNYNLLSNNGESEVSGDSLSSKDDLDKIKGEIDELGQLKKIFTDRNSSDMILAKAEFKNFIEGIDQRIEQLKKIGEIVKERLNSRLKENHNFLVDTINNLTEQVGISSDGSVINQALHDLVEKKVSPEVFGKLKTSLQDLAAQENKDASDIYWNISGEVAAIQQLLKSEKVSDIISEVKAQKQSLLNQMEKSRLMTKLGDTAKANILNNITDSVLGTLQTLFYTRLLFTQIGVTENDKDFLDDKPSSPVYKFREHYNLRRFIREVEKDDSRTDKNTPVSKEDLLEFLNLAKKMQDLEDFENNLDSELNLIKQIEKEKKVAQLKSSKEDNTYENAIIPSIQQLFFLRTMSGFLKRKTIKDKNKIGFRNWAFIQAPGGAGKTQSIGTWFNIVSGVPADKVMATAYTKEAARSVQKALQVDTEGTKDVEETIAKIKDLMSKGDYSQEVLIIDEFPAIDINTQKRLFDTVNEYTENKLKLGKGEFKVIALGDTSQLTFATDGSVSPVSGAITNPDLFKSDKEEGEKNDNHIAKMLIIPSLTVNFRSNLFAITSFSDKFRGSSESNVESYAKTASTDPSLESKDVKGVVSVNKADFKTKLINYLKLNQDSTRTRALIVNESKINDYKKLLEDNNIKIIEDPNDELTKGVYLTTVKNVQGFSFDEVFIDFDNKDKKLFSNTVSPNTIYNKAMYVAVSRARNLVIVTNFPNNTNIKDEGIADLENKSISELQTKDKDFESNRDQEIEGAKSILGDQYNRQTETVVEPEETTEPVEEEVPEEEKAGEDPEEESEETEPEPAAEQTETEEETETPEEAPETEEEVFEEDEDVLPASGEENLEEDDNAEDESQKEPIKKGILEKIKDVTVTAFAKTKAGVINFVFPTAHTIKYKIKDGEFRAKIKGESYEYRDLRAGDDVIFVPFVQSKDVKDPKRNFGYAVITPAVNSDGEVVPNEYRTVSVLSDEEIDELAKVPETAALFEKIVNNEKRDKGFVSLTYDDVADKNGFKTTPGKNFSTISKGKIVAANSVKYFYTKDKYRTLTKTEIEGDGKTTTGIINQFIETFYKKRIEYEPAFKQTLQQFYAEPQNARIVVFTKDDLNKKKAQIKVPEDYKLQPGRPYFMFTTYDDNSSNQFIPLSRKYLNTKHHTDTLAPIEEFIKAGKVIRTLLKKKGIDGKIGYDKNVSKLLSKISNDYLENNVSKEGTFNIKIGETTYKFSAVEAEKIHDFYIMFSSPNLTIGKAVNEKEIRNMIKLNSKKEKVSKVRNLKLDDGTVIKGTVDSYDSETKTFRIKNAVTGELTQPLSGTIRFSGAATKGPAQKALDNIFNSNGHIAKYFTSIKGKTNFVTSKDRDASEERKKGDHNPGYKFMNLLGSKTSPVVKTYNSEGQPETYYEDVLDILENLFNFAEKGELSGKELSYYDSASKSIKKIQAKFRVPIPLKQEQGTVFDYTNSASNTSRQSPEVGEIFFETNFDTLIPSQIYAEFTATAGSPNTKIEVGEERSSKAEVKVDPTGINFVEPQSKIEMALTKEELLELPFNEIKDRLTKEQKEKLEKSVIDAEWESLEQFFSETETITDSNEQAFFRQHLLNCMM